MSTQPQAPKPIGIDQQTSVYDKDDAVSRLGSETLLKKIAFMFLSNSPDLINAISTKVAQADAKGIERAAHQLGSSIAYFSANRASTAALRLENMGREGDLSELTEAFGALETEISELRVALAELLPEEGRPRES